MVRSDMLPANVNQAVAAVSLDSEWMLPSFALWLLLTPQMQRRLLSNVVEFARANISLTNLRELEVIMPDLPTQQVWSDIACGVLALESRVSMACNGVETLSSSLTQRAFRGELDATRETQE